MPLHINATDLDTIVQIFYRELPDAKVYAFGSRVSDSEPNNEADLDLAVMTGHIISSERMIAIERSMAEAGLPFTVDVFDYAKLTNKLRNIVEEKNVVIRGIGSSKVEG